MCWKPRQKWGNALSLLAVAPHSPGEQSWGPPGATHPPSLLPLSVVFVEELLKTGWAGAVPGACGWREVI